MDQHSLCVSTIKGLAMDAVQAANSGHPGMPMGTADIATVLWTQFLKHDPADDQWADRDRFVLSAGHGSMLLYSLLHLSGYDLSLDEIKRFRQMGSATPGHPEYGHTPGVETTTGPLGQGFANGVGMALAERFLRETFGSELVNHYIYGIVSDGDLMEGISSEAASIAGHLQLGHLIYLYDDNQISIDGSTDITFSEDRVGRFQAHGWHTQVIDGHNAKEILAAIQAARNVTDKPSIICCRTIIGKDCPIEGTSKTHGAPLGEEYIRATKEKLGLNPDESFVVPSSVYQAFQSHQGSDERLQWEERLSHHPRKHEFQAWLKGDASPILDAVEWPTFEEGASLATRKASAACLKAITAYAGNIIGGSADLAGSNGVAIGKKAFTPEQFAGAASIHFGVREHAMGAICNGIALHGGVIPYCATFLVFHDYMRPAVRLSSLMGQRVIYVYSHDSIFLGEDGPTHQPIETLCAMRIIPGMRVLRPADAHEVVEAWKTALSHSTGPTAIVLTRQGVPVLPPPTSKQFECGARVVLDSDEPNLVFIGTGSEVSPCIEAANLLAQSGIQSRVVSMPSVEMFLAQDATLQESILPNDLPRVSVEAGTTVGWMRIVGNEGLSIGIDRFGASAPISDLKEAYGLTPAQIASRVQSYLETRKG